MYEKLWACLDKDSVGQCKGTDILDMLKDEAMGMKLLESFKHTVGGQKDGPVTQDEFEQMLRELST